MSKMWEVDPETKSKLQDIAKTNDNNRCIDCGAPSPQWASPKLGIFFCLACSGIHRSLGVHISFVRSCTMDAFKTAEVKRMALGGNKPYIDFFNTHPSNTPLGTTFEQCTIAERYDSEAGEEWKERLTCKVEERDYVPGATKKETRAQKTAAGELPGSSTPSGTSSPSRQGAASPSQKSKNEAYFARQGAVNASRPEDLPPSQGGKFSGFGSAPSPNSSNNNVPNANDFQADPVAALTKGFGWLSSNLTKQAASVNRSYIQPGIKDFAASDFAAQARQVGTNLGTGVQQGARGLNDQFQKFVDPETGAVTGGTRSGSGAGAGPEKRDFWDSFGQDPAGPPREKQDFWDDFAAAGEAKQQGAGGGKPKSVGTSAMKTGGSGGGAAAKKEEGDGWRDW